MVPTLTVGSSIRVCIGYRADGDRKPIPQWRTATVQKLDDGEGLEARIRTIAGDGRILGRAAEPKGDDSEGGFEIRGLRHVSAPRVAGCLVYRTMEEDAQRLARPPAPIPEAPPAPPAPPPPPAPRLVGEGGTESTLPLTPPAPPPAGPMDVGSGGDSVEVEKTGDGETSLPL